MIAGEPIVPETQTIVRKMAVIRPHFGGLLYPNIKLEDIGTIIPGGTLLGSVISPYTFETLEEIRARSPRITSSCCGRRLPRFIRVIMPT